MYSNKPYCINCFNIKKSENESYKSLLKLICEYFNIEVCTGLILKQVKQYRDEFNYNYDGISYTLWFCKEILQKQFISKYGIALVKYEYENAKSYYEQQCKIEKSIISGEHNLIKQVKHQNNKHITTSLLLNIDEIIKGGDK